VSSLGGAAGPRSDSKAPLRAVPEPHGPQTLPARGSLGGRRSPRRHSGPAPPARRRARGVPPAPRSVLLSRALRQAAPARRKGGKTSLRGSDRAGLSLYTEYPTMDVSLEEFDRFSCDRLNLLCKVEDARSRGDYKEREALIRTEDRATVGATVERDEISHFTLRLAFSRTEDDRQWFLKQEAELFRIRFRASTEDEKRAVLAGAGVDIRPLTRDRFEAARGDLADVLTNALYWSDLREKAGYVQGVRGQGGMDATDKVLGDFYEVPFQLVPELVASRSVLLRAGQAYLHKDQLEAVVAGKFRSLLSQSLAQVGQKWNARHYGDEADRLVPIIESLPSRRFANRAGGASFSAGEAISARDVGTLAKDHFPLCMFNLYDHLHTDRHLKVSCGAGAGGRGTTAAPRRRRGGQTIAAPRPPPPPPPPPRPNRPPRRGARGPPAPRAPAARREAAAGALPQGPGAAPRAGARVLARRVLAQDDGRGL